MRRRAPRDPKHTDGVRFYLRLLAQPVRRRRVLPGRDRPHLDRSGS